MKIHMSSSKLGSPNANTGAVFRVVLAENALWRLCLSFLSYRKHLKLKDDPELHFNQVTLIAANLRFLFIWPTNAQQVAINRRG
jgi:hypothetical protein